MPSRTDTNRYRRAAVYALFVVWTGFILVRQEADDRDRRAQDEAIIEDVRQEAQDRIRQVENEALARAFSQCQTSNEARQGIREFVEALVMGDDGVVSEREREAIELAESKFAPLSCPPEPTQQEIDAAEDRRENP